MKRIVSVGEVMIEIGRSRADAGCLERRCGGDTLNTSVYLARLLPPERFAVHYVTRLGDDWLSDWMVEQISAEGVICAAIGRAEGGRPGLYLIETDARGERSFSFWRESAPVRRLFDGATSPDVDALAGSYLLYVTGITLAVLGPAGREALLGAMAAHRAAGAAVAFDTNHRPALWESPAAARDWVRRAAAEATLLLPSLEDLDSLFGTGSPEPACAACRDLTDGTIVLKTGGGPIHLDRNGRREVVALERQARSLDTTAAGDAFNAGFMAAQLMGLPMSRCCGLAHALASRVVMNHGAIAPRDTTADLADRLAAEASAG